MTESKSVRQSYAAGLLALLVLVAADQVTKYLAVSNLKGNSPIILIEGVFELFYLENRGAAFGMMANRQWFFIIIALIMTAVSIYGFLYLPRQKRFLALRICAVLIAAGAVGNMCDRMMHRYVVDFLYFSLIDFPVFNVADCYVVVGAVLLILLLFTVHRNDSFENLDPRKDSH